MNNWTPGRMYESRWLGWGNGGSETLACFLFYLQLLGPPVSNCGPGCQYTAVQFKFSGQGPRPTLVFFNTFTENIRADSERVFPSTLITDEVVMLRDPYSEYSE